MILPMDMVVLMESSLSCSNFSLIMVMAGPMGTDVKSAFTSYELMHSSCCSLMSLILYI